MQDSIKDKNIKNLNILPKESKVDQLKNNSFEIIKPRSYSIDRKNKNKNPIKINCNIIGSNMIKNHNENKIFMNTIQFPKVIPRLSLSNFLKKNNNNGLDNIFNKTLRVIGFRTITFNKGLNNFRKVQYKLNNINSFKDTFKYKFVKDQMLNTNNSKNTNKIRIIINDKAKTEKAKAKVNLNKNYFNSNTIINKNKKRENKEVNENENKLERKGNKIKKDFNKENKDYFIKEMDDFLSNVKINRENQTNYKKRINDNENDNYYESDDDKEPYPKIFKVNKSRPQTSYGGLNVRRKNLQKALRAGNNRPVTSKFP